MELGRFLNTAGTPSGKFSPYADLLIAICLAQGTAQHFLDLQQALSFDKEVVVSSEEVKEKGLYVLPTGHVINGIKDIDVWFFFERHDDRPIPNRRHCRKSLHTRLLRLGERRLDFMKKGVSTDLIQKASYARQEVVRTYLRETADGRNFLSRKSLVGLYPGAIFGQVIWRVTRRIRG